MQDQQQREADPAAAAADLAAVKQMLVDNAGLLQMLLLMHTCNDAGTPTAALCRMSMPQFRAMLVAAQVGIESCLVSCWPLMSGCRMKLMLAFVHRAGCCPITSMLRHHFHSI